MLFELENMNLTIESNDILQIKDLQFKENQLTTVSGHSGSGKSTLLKIMANLIPITEGSVLYKGTQINDIPYPEYRKKVAYVYQTPTLFGETIQENLAFPSHIRDDKFNEARALDLLNQVGLDYLTLNREINNLSGGEKQRISLIRYLMYPPEVLLLDEITASLDNDSSNAVWNLLKKFAKEENATLIWVSHDLSDDELAERKITLENGNIKEIAEND